jgi:hypothetical protein
MRVDSSMLKTYRHSSASIYEAVMRKWTKSRQNATRSSRTATGFTFSRKFPIDAGSVRARKSTGRFQDFKTTPGQFHKFHPALRFARGMHRFARRTMSGARVKGSSVTSGGGRIRLLKYEGQSYTLHGPHQYTGAGDGRPSTLDLRKSA